MPIDEANVEILRNTIVPASATYLVPSASTTLATIIIGFTIATTYVNLTLRAPCESSNFPLEIACMEYLFFKPTITLSISGRIHGISSYL
jgi:hypothetical protein